MIAPLPTALNGPHGDALGKVLVRCEECRLLVPLSLYSSHKGLPDLRTILTCDDPAEVGEMVGATLMPLGPWPICGGSDVTDSTATPDPNSEQVIWCLDCKRIVSDMPPFVTARWLLWPGQPVRWGEERRSEGVLWWGPVNEWPKPVPLDAVVLVGEPDECPDCADTGVVDTGECDINCRLCEELEQRIAAAREACAAAGVQWINPNYPEQRRLQL